MTCFSVFIDSTASGSVTILATLNAGIRWLPASGSVTDLATLNAGIRWLPASGSVTDLATLNDAALD